MHTLTALLLAVAAATPTPTPAPVAKSGSGQARTLADVARERKLGIKGVVGGTLSVAGTAGTTYYSPELAARVQRENDKAGLAASDEMWRTIKQERWVEENIHSPYNAHLHINAQRDWDSAAENCRKTPGCTPFYRK